MPRRRAKRSLPILLTELVLASAETIARRGWLIATGNCPPAEYRRMGREKMKAAEQTGLALLSKRPNPAQLLTPWHRAARRNAQRLRRRINAGFG